MASALGMVESTAALFVRGHNPRYWAAKRAPWVRWRQFCAAGAVSLRLPDDPVQADLRMADFAAYLHAQGLAASTLGVYTQAVLLLQRRVLQVKAPKGFALAAVLRGAAAAATSPPRAKVVLAPDQVCALLRSLGVGSHDDLALRVALVVQLAGGWRVSAVAAAPTLRHTIRWGDVRFWPSLSDATVVTVLERSSKTCQPGRAPPREVSLHAAPALRELCPVLHLRAWHERCCARFGSLARDQPLFLLASSLCLTASHVNRWLHARERELGWQPGLVTSHVLRVSSATWMRVAGAGSRLVYKHHDWSDPSANSTAERTYNREGKFAMRPVVARMYAVSGRDVALGAPVASGGVAPDPPLTLAAPAAKRRRR